MKLLITIILCITITWSVPLVLGQENFGQKLSTIKPMVTTKKNILKILGKGETEENITWYKFDDRSLEIIYSTGKCTEGWLAPKGTVIEFSVIFFEEKELSRLPKELSSLPNKIELENLRFQNHYDDGGKTFFDDNNGIRYEVNSDQKTSSLITFYPSSKYSCNRCEN